MSIKTRAKIFKILAQSLPTEQVVKSITAVPPPTFQASLIYPGIRYGFNSMSVKIIDDLVSLLNTAIHYTTAGKINFQYFRNNNFNFDASQAPSVDQKNLMNLSKKVYITFLNGGTAFSKQLSGSQIADMTDILLSSQELNNLSKVSPTGILATKIQGNLRDIIIKYLRALKLANPIAT